VGEEGGQLGPSSTEAPTKETWFEERVMRPVSTSASLIDRHGAIDAQW
jgi:post-segregation antitoxin (ccd killing protein)